MRFSSLRKWRSNKDLTLKKPRPHPTAPFLMTTTKRIGNQLKKTPKRRSKKAMKKQFKTPTLSNREEGDLKMMVTSARK